MKLGRLYHAIRLIGYLSGLAGMVVWFAGRSGEGSEALQRLGAGLLLVMFACLTGAYVFYMVFPRGRAGSPRDRTGRRAHRSRRMP